MNLKAISHAHKAPKFQQKGLRHSSLKKSAPFSKNLFPQKSLFFSSAALRGQNCFKLPQMSLLKTESPSISINKSLYHTTINSIRSSHPALNSTRAISIQSSHPFPALKLVTTPRPVLKTSFFDQKIEPFIFSRNAGLLVSEHRWKDRPTVTLDELPYADKTDSRCIPPKHSQATEKLFAYIPLRIMKAGVTDMTTAEGKIKLAVMRTSCNYGKKDLQKYLEHIYKLKIRKINTLNYDAKFKRKVAARGTKVIWRRHGSNYKKAYVQFYDPQLTKRELYKKFKNTTYYDPQYYRWRGLGPFFLKSTPPKETKETS